MKGTLENIFQLLQIKSKACFLPSKDLFFFQSAEILLEKEKIGILGEIHPQVDHKYRQINKPIFIAELSLSKLFNYLDDFSPKPVYQQISNFPTSERDLSFIFFENIDYNKVIKEIKKSSSEVLQKISILDVYQDSKMAKASQKSVCFRLTFQNFFKTLEKRELEKTIKVIIKRVEKLFSAKSRSD